MKKLLVVAMCFMFTVTAMYAGCGKKVNNAGVLKSFTAESKQVVVDEKGKSVKLKTTPDTKYFDKEGGSEVKVESLIGKSVKVVSEHSKIDSITGV